MLNVIYRLGRIFMSKGWIAGLLLIALTIGFGTHGFLATKWENCSDLTLSDALYKASSLLAIQTGSLPTSGNWQLELARWLGMLFFASALLTFAIRLSQESAHRILVYWFAKNHIIIAGLGQNGGKLVKALRQRGRTVVVIESSRTHHAIEQCREAGAVVLFGEPNDEATLLAAKLPRATAILALFGDERECVRIATTAYDVLHSEKATRRKPPVRCVLRLIEPGLLNVIRSHKIKTDPTDGIHLEILNSHEIAATTMVREARASSIYGSLGKLMVLGLGTHHRLGEMVVLRAAKDHLILNDSKPGEKLVIDVYDKHASEWLETVRTRYPFLDKVCTIRPHSCWARKVGGTGIDQDYDAVFVCIPDEGQATAQAVMLRREVLTVGQPIMVRVMNSRSGYGGLIATPDSGWGENLHPVGLEDPLYDPDTATQPELELRAQTIHHDYRTRQKGRSGAANKPWIALGETFREANRKLAERYASHLAFKEGHLKTTRYHWKFHPNGFTPVNTNDSLLFRFNDDELEALAAREHFLWKEEREAAGWRYGPEKDAEKKTNPLLVDYTKLTDEDARQHNREFVRRIPLILALADYTIVEDKLRETFPIANALKS